MTSTPPPAASAAQPSPHPARAASPAPPAPPGPAVAAGSGATSIPAYLLTGVALLGLPGWALDSWLGTRGFVAAGVLAGLGLAMYVVWVRYVGPATAAAAGPPGGAHPAEPDEESAR